MLKIGKELDESLMLVQEKSSKSEFKEYRRAVGKIMGYMLTEVMNVIYREHPSLRPPELL